MSDPSLSVTVLNHNYAKYLPACLDSILSQTFTDFELIIIDDCSSDTSREVLRAYADDPRVRIVEHEQNQGFVGSLVEGTEVLSRGRLLMVISADDLALQPDAFATQVLALDRNPTAALCFTGYRVVEADGALGDLVEAPIPPDVAVPGETFLERYMTRTGIHVLHSGAMIRREAYERAGGYRRDLRYAVDFAMWGVLALAGDVIYCRLAGYGYRVHAGQMSRSLAGVRTTLAEVLICTDRVFAQARERGLAIAARRGEAVRFHLFSEALPDALQARRRMALRRVLAALMLRPCSAVRSRALWEVMLLLCLGTSGYQAVRSITRVSLRWRVRVESSQPR